MMLQPLRDGGRKQYSSTVSLPSPTAGLVTAKNIADMQPDEAIIMENWYPDLDALYVRKGYTSFATGMTGAIETLTSYSAPSSDKFLAANAGKIYEISAGGAVGAALGTGYTSNRWQSINVGTSGAYYTLMVNGSDTPIKYDGSTISTNSITGSGLTSSNLIHINLFKQRVFFTEKNTLKFWYLPVNSISGAASAFDLAPYCKLGGYLMAMGSWTRDSGSGQDDLAVFVTSRGEVLIYQGSDPGNANAWSLVGVFNTGAPIGRRCMLRYGAELVILTQDGAIPLSTVMSLGQISANTTAFSKNIYPTFKTAAQTYKSVWGWQPIFYPKGQYALVNVPTIEDTTAQQFVVNVATGAWTTFTGMNACCWEVFQDNLYFGGADGKVYKADYGYTDNGGSIYTDLATSFQYFGQRGKTKKIQMVKPIFTASKSPEVSFNINVDFVTTPPQYTVNTPVNSLTQWDTAIWDVSPWGDESAVYSNWLSGTAVGRCASLRMRMTSNFNCALNGIEWMLQPGNDL